MIRAVYRVQCDGCGTWILSFGDPVPAVFTGERAARLTAERFGWEKHPHDTVQPYRWLCPDCKTNPLGITLPPWPDHLKEN